MTYEIEPFVFPPNWSTPVDETLDWKTSIEVSHNETEQRMGLRINPRRSFEYKMWIRREQAARFENKMFVGMDKQWALPLWTEPCLLTAQTNSGASTLNVVTADKSFVVAGYALLFKSALQFELVQIDAFNGTTITTVDPVVTTWAAGSRLYPVMVSQINSQLSLSYHTSNLFETSVRFTGMPDVTNTRTVVEDAAETFQGVEIYMKGTNWIAGIQRDLITLAADEDVESGLFRRRSRSGLALPVRSFQWLNRDVASSNELRKFFARRRGMLNPVWLSTGTDDFQLVASAVAADSEIQVRDTSYGTLVDMNAARKFVLIELRDGTNIVREIAEYEVASGIATLTLGDTLDNDITVATTKRISFLQLCRMAGDSVTFSWATDRVSVVQSTFKVLAPV